MNDTLIIFGGADRGMTHFADLAICQKGVFSTSGKLVWKRKETNGDIPQPRSGHAIAVYGKFMFLFGGIDFSEEAVFNDLYIFDSGMNSQCSISFLSFQSLHVNKPLCILQNHSNGNMSAKVELKYQNVTLIR